MWSEDKNYESSWSQVDREAHGATIAQKQILEEGSTSALPKELAERKSHPTVKVYAEMRGVGNNRRIYEFVQRA